MTASDATIPRPGEVTAPYPFDPDVAHRLSPRVGLRPEPFGALAYHFDTRRLVFLKAPELVDLVRSLADHPSADAAITAAVEPHRHRSFVAALAALAEAGVVEPVTPPARSEEVS